MKYRIKQIDEKKFIPQVKTFFLGSWRSIDKYDLHLWVSEIAGSINFICETLDQAKQVIDNYKANQKNKRKYPKYHKP